MPLSCFEQRCTNSSTRYIILLIFISNLFVATPNFINLPNAPYISYSTILQDQPLPLALERKGHRILNEVEGRFYINPQGVKTPLRATDASKIIGMWWKLLLDEEKQPYQELAAEGRRVHKEQYPHYNYRASALAATSSSVTTFVDTKPKGKCKAAKEQVVRKTRNVADKKKTCAKYAATKGMFSHAATQDVREQGTSTLEFPSARAVQPPVRAPSCPPLNTIPSISRSRRAPALQRAETMPNLSYSQEWDSLNGAMCFHNQAFSFAPRQNATTLLAEGIAPHEVPSLSVGPSTFAEPTFTPAFTQEPSSGADVAFDLNSLGHALVQDALMTPGADLTYSAPLYDIAAPTPSYYTSPNEIFESTSGPLDNFIPDQFDSDFSGINVPECYSPTIPLSNYARGMEGFNEDRFGYLSNDTFDCAQDGQYFNDTPMYEAAQDSFNAADANWIPQYDL
jgi:hypothetical protein